MAKGVYRMDGNLFGDSLVGIHRLNMHDSEFCKCIQEPILIVALRYEINLGHRYDHTAIASRERAFSFCSSLALAILARATPAVI